MFLRESAVPAAVGLTGRTVASSLTGMTRTTAATCRTRLLARGGDAVLADVLIMSQRPGVGSLPGNTSREGLLLDGSALSGAGRTGAPFPGNCPMNFSCRQDVTAGSTLRDLLADGPGLCAALLYLASRSRCVEGNAQQVSSGLAVLQPLGDDAEGQILNPR
jgi:hypothetical protein